MQTIVPMEEMYRKSRGVPSIVGTPADFYKDVQERINNSLFWGNLELYTGSAKDLVAELEMKDVQIEKEVREELLGSVFSRALKDGDSRFAVDLVEVTASTFNLDEDSSYIDVFVTATSLYGLIPCVNYVAPCLALIHAKYGKVPKDPYVVFARDPLAEMGNPILFTLEIKSRTWGGVTLGAVNGALDFVSPWRKYIFAKKYTRIS